MTFTLFKIKRVVKLGFKSIVEHKLRSLLTALGIIFGVSSVIAMLAIGEGASYEAREQIRAMGSTNIIVVSRKPEASTSSGNATQTMSIYGLTYDDALRIKVLFPSLIVQVPARIIKDFIHHGPMRVPGRIIGTVPWYLERAPIVLKKGRFLTPEDIATADNVTVLGEDTARELFPLTPPVGQNVYLGNQAYRVIGTVGKTHVGKGQKGDTEKDVHEAYIPITAAKKRFGEVLIRRETGSFQMEKVELHQLTLTAPSNEAVIPISKSVRAMLEHFHKKKDFEIIIPLKLLEQAESTKRIFNIVLGSIAAISLLVGGIGIMNIMLASVTERTREIGIRRALGATRQDIVVQFLTEALLLSIAGGALGVALGIAIPAIVTQVAGLKTIIRTDSLFLAFSFSVMTGIVFGIYPAIRAAALNPIDALRHE